MSREIFQGMAICACIFLLGAQFGDFLHLDGWAIKKEIDPLQVISIATSVLLVVYVSILFDRAKERYKTKKEILIKKSDSLVNLIRDLTKQVRTSKIETNEASSVFKTIFIEFDELYDFIDKSKMSEKNLEKRFTDRLRKVKSLATKTPPRGAVGKQEIYIKDNFICYGSSRSGKIVSELNVLKAEIVNEQIRLIDL